MFLFFFWLVFYHNECNSVFRAVISQSIGRVMVDIEIFLCALILSGRMYQVQMGVFSELPVSQVTICL